MDEETRALFNELKQLVSNKADQLHVINIPLGSANTESRWQLPKGCKGFTMQCRDGTAVRFSTKRDVVAKPNPPYATLKANTPFDDTDLDIQSSDEALYFACSSSDKVMEIIVRM